MAWELRWHPLREEWVLFTSHRDSRPWLGAVDGNVEPPVPEANALGPGGRRIGTVNPDYRGVYTFTNDLPVFSDAAPAPTPGNEFYRSARAAGTAEVVCYHHDPATSLGELEDDEVTAVVLEWRRRTEALQTRPDVAHVLIFENRGAAVGTSNPHPHCQIYAGSLVYKTMEREAEVASRHFASTGREILADVVEHELVGGRIIAEGSDFFACVPWFARWSYEVLVLPRRAVASITALSDVECRSLALVLREVVQRYDALWGIRMPYVMAVHQAPVGHHPHFPFHIEFHPPLRAPGLRKFLAGPELGGGSMTNESDPDDKAKELRDALGG